MSVKRGSILAETVLVMPLLFFLVFGVIQFALVWTAKHMTAYAAFCAARAVMVVPPDEQEAAALDAAKVALSWISVADKDHRDGRTWGIPGWGKIPGAGSLSVRIVDEDDGKRVRKNGKSDNEPVAAVRVHFRFPLIIPGMAVNKVIGNLSDRQKDPKTIQMQEGSRNYVANTFYDDLRFATGEGRFNNSDFEQGGQDAVDGWPYITITETCVLPMPYSTKNFPTGGFDGTIVRGGGS